MCKKLIQSVFGGPPEALKRPAIAVADKSKEIAEQTVIKGTDATDTGATGIRKRSKKEGLPGLGL